MTSNPDERDLAKGYSIIRRDGKKRTTIIRTQKELSERRRINPEKGLGLAKGGRIFGTAGQLFLGTPNDRGKQARRRKRKKWYQTHIRRL